MLTFVLGVLLLIAAVNSYNHARYVWGSGYSWIWVSLEFALGSVVLVTAVLLMTSVVHAQDTAVDFNPAAEELRAYLVDIALLLAMVLATWLAKKLREKFGVDLELQLRALEEKHRGTLHSAVDTWTKAAMAKYGPDLKFEVGNPALEFVLRGVAKSAPDAIKQLGATEQWIANKAAGIAGVEPPRAAP